MSKKGTPTRYPGVSRIDDTTFRLRGRVRDPKTGHPIDLDKIIEAENAHKANEQRSKLLAELDRPRVTAQERKRLRAYATSWLASKLPTLKASTRAHLAEVLDNHVLPELGDHFVDAITLDDLVAWRDGQAAKVIRTKNPDDPEGPPLERVTRPATVNARLRVLKTVLRAACEDLGLKDPTRRLAALREVRTDDDRNCLSADELRVLLEKAQQLQPRWYPLFYTLAFSGMRFGEVTALRWSDVDREGERIVIREAQWKGVIDTTKTGVTRSVPLSPELADVLDQHRAAQREAIRKRLQRQHVPKLEALQRASEDGLVFPGRAGQLMHNTAPRDALLECLKAAGVTHRVTVHGFRRTFNNLLRQVAGDAVVVRSMTGHVTEEMTAHYSWVGDHEKRDAVNSLLRLVTEKQA